MGTETVPSPVDGDIVIDDVFNTINSILSLNFVPRNSSGVATDEAGALGTYDTPFRRLHEYVGGFNRGDIKVHFSFAGSQAPGAGWMLCDGRVITKENYDVEHGADSWDSDVVSTVLENAYLPDLVNRFTRGASTTTQTGESAITAIGTPGNVKDLGHVHHWNNFSATYDSNGNPVAYSSVEHPLGVAGFNCDDYEGGMADTYTSKELSSVRVLPKCFHVEYYMRII